MSKCLKLGIVGLIHDHVWDLLTQFITLRNVKIISAADANPPLLKKVKERFGVPKLYKDFSDMIIKEELDAILVCTENSRHADVVEVAAEEGMHIIMEKPMSANLEQAERILKAVKRHKVKVMVNYPTAWNPAIRQAYSMIQDNGIGDIFHVYYRAAHAGPKEIGCSPYFYNWLYNKKLNGAGAFMDYCCYGVNIALWFLKRKPKSVIATMGTFARKYLTVDDNAILIMEYDDALGVAEASWSQIGDYPIHGPIINGTKGSIVVKNNKVHLFVMRREGDYRDIKSEVLTPSLKGPRNGPEYFVKCIKEDRPIKPPLSAKFNRDVQEVLEAGLRSAFEGKRIMLHVR